MKKAFTLIELLVVIAIIAILAAILFPVFAQAKEAAKKTQCLSNVKNLATAAQLYGGDYDDTVLPELTCRDVGSATFCPGGPTLTDARMWTYVIQPYVKNGGGHPKAGIFADPSFSLANFKKSADQASCDSFGQTGLPGSAGFTTIATDANGKERSYSDYGVVFAMCAPSEVTTAFPCTTYTDYNRDGLSAANAALLYPGSLNYPRFAGGLTRGFGEIARPAETVIIGDGITAIMPLAPPIVKVAGNYILDAIGCESTFAHSGGGNFGFCDGHAKFLKGNPEAYRKQVPSGLWVETYFFYAE